MDLAELQQKVPQLTNLLPSQREWLERLLFQMTFNKPGTVNIIGPASSGKSTLALAVAELFSDHYNVALLDATKPDLAQTLVQQWFGSTLQPEKTLREQLEQANTSSPLLLIVDNADQLSAELQQQLAGVATVQLAFSLEQIADYELVLVLNRLTHADAAQLLKGQDVNDLDIAQRLADADSNISQLLSVNPVTASTSPAAGSVALNPYITLGAGAGLILLAALFWFLNSTSTEPERRQVSAPVPQSTEITSATAADTVSDPATTAVDTKEPLTLAVEKIPTEDLLQQTELVTPTIEDEVAQVTVEMAPPQVTVVESAQEQEALALGNDDSVTEALPAPVEQEHDNVAEYLYDELLLLSYDKARFAVQLAVLSSDNAYKRFKQTYPGVSVVTYQRNWQGKQQLVLLLADYPDKVSARAVITELPEALRATGPFIKSLQSVQTEIRLRPAVQVQQE